MFVAKYLNYILSHVDIKLLIKFNFDNVVQFYKQIEYVTRYNIMFYTDGKDT